MLSYILYNILYNIILYSIYIILYYIILYYIVYMLYSILRNHFSTLYMCHLPIIVSVSFTTLQISTKHSADVKFPRSIDSNADVKFPRNILRNRCLLYVNVEKALKLTGES